jgi:uncharacterized membrane protein
VSRTRPSFWQDFKRFFYRGLGILLPSVLTLWIVVQAFLFVERQVAAPINAGIREAVLWVVPQTFDEKDLPEWFRVTPEEIAAHRASTRSRELSNDMIRATIRREELQRYWDIHWYFRFIGLAVAVVLIYLAGLLLGGFFGKQIAALFEERLLRRIPVIKQVYPHVKQVVDMIMGERSVAFKRVVLVQYPSKGLWSVGFLTGESLDWADAAEHDRTLTVYVPSTPTPFTGFTVAVKANEVLEISMTVDEALRFLLTGGVLSPTAAPGARLFVDRASISAPLAGPDAPVSVAPAAEEKSGA